MTDDRLTVVELQVSGGVSKAMAGIDFTEPDMWHLIRSCMKETAYHEAAHIAVAAFAGGKSSPQARALFRASHCSQSGRVQ